MAKRWWIQVPTHPLTRRGSQMLADARRCSQMLADARRLTPRVKWTEKLSKGPKHVEVCPTKMWSCEHCEQGCHVISITRITLTSSFLTSTAKPEDALPCIWPAEIWQTHWGSAANPFRVWEQLWRQITKAAAKPHPNTGQSKATRGV